MKMLMLGGTQFLGRAYADDALKRGHDVTLFTRGQTNPQLFPEAEHLVGDRAADLSALAGRTWDAVIDTCGYDPDVVRRCAALLRTAAGHYTFISSVSVYRDRLGRGVDEGSPVKTDADVDDDGGYGARKAACERIVHDAFEDRTLILRPGVIVGPHENVGRLPFWLRCAADWERMIAPVPADRTIQLLDARDIAAGGLGLVEQQVGGLFNLAAPEGEQTFRDLVTDCLEVTDSTADVTWVDDAALETAGVEIWSELPLWAPVRYAGVWAVDTSRAQEAGFVSRPLHETVADTWDWLRDSPELVPRAPWLTREKAAAIGSVALGL